MAQLNTRIVLRNDSTVNWNASSDQVLLKGEVGVEFLEDGKVKVKIGDGVKTWSELPYFGGGADVNTYEATPVDGESHIDAITRVLNGATPSKGDVAIVKEAIVGETFSYTAYVFNGTEWAATDGNYDAENVFFGSDLTLTASVGVQTVDANSSKKLETAGKNLKQVLDMLFAEEVEPERTNPSITKITLSCSGAKEVGTEVTPSYEVVYEDGNYSTADGEATGANATAYNVSDTAGHTATEYKGAFDSFVVLDNTNYKVSATVDYSAGNVPKTNLGNDCVDKQIAAGTTDSKSSSAVTGYRAYFYGILDSATDDAALTSELIRGLKNGGNYTSSKTLKVEVAGAAAKRIVVAIPKASTRAGVTKVMKTDGLATEITASYKAMETFVSVADARGTVDGVDTNTVEYKVWVYEPASIDAAEVHEITLG